MFCFFIAGGYGNCGGAGGSSYSVGDIILDNMGTTSGNGQITITMLTPTSQPTGQPSHIPSTQPSGSPTRIPSGQPSVSPTRQPSSQPSRNPSSQPSRQPTRQPSSQPTNKPTNQPSSQPSRQPSSQPILKPTDQPTNQPSRKPTEQPTYPTTTPLIKTFNYTGSYQIYKVPLYIDELFVIAAGGSGGRGYNQRSRK